jgi:hypothetical protein
LGFFVRWSHHEQLIHRPKYSRSHSATPELLNS